MKRVTLVVLLFSSSLAACEQKPSVGDAPQVAEEPAEEPAVEVAWRDVEPSALTAEQAKMLERAKGAQKELGPKLMATVLHTVEKRGHAAALQACKLEAPKLTSGAGDAAKVKIGRTSHKLRNPENVAPVWMADIVEAKEGKPHVRLGPEGQLGWAAPIHLMGPCTSCHGDTAELASGVPEALAKLYPEDQATGFEPGDLRGWFWVEVAAN